MHNISHKLKIHTGWSEKTVTSKFSLTDLKNTKNGVTQSFLESLYPTIWASSIYFKFAETLHYPGWLHPGGHYSAYGPFWWPQDGRIGLWRGQSTWYLCGPPMSTNRWHLSLNLAMGGSEDLRGPQKGPSGAETATFVVFRNVVDAPEVLRRPWEPKCLWLVQLCEPHKYKVLWPLQRLIRPSCGPPNGP